MRLQKDLEIRAQLDGAGIPCTDADLHYFALRHFSDLKAAEKRSKDPNWKYYDNRHKRRNRRDQRVKAVGEVESSVFYKTDWLVASRTS